MCWEKGNIDVGGCIDREFTGLFCPLIIEVWKEVGY